MLSRRPTHFPTDKEMAVCLSVPDAVGFLAGLAVDFSACDLVRIDDKAAVLALAHGGIEAERLPEGHPDRAISKNRETRTS